MYDSYFQISIRAFMTAKLQDYEGYQILNFDESPFYPFKNRGKVIIERSAIGSATWKEKDPKSRVTFGPVVQFSKKLGFKPCFVVPVKQTLWKHKPIKIETKSVIYKEKEDILLRKEYSNFVTYYRPKSWIHGPLFKWEMTRPILPTKSIEIDLFWLLHSHPALFRK